MARHAVCCRIGSGRKSVAPARTIAFHWGAALGFYIARGDDCVQGLAQVDKSLVTGRPKYVNDGAAQMGTVEHEVGALVPG